MMICKVNWSLNLDASLPEVNLSGDPKTKIHQGQGSWLPKLLLQLIQDVNIPIKYLQGSYLTHLLTAFFTKKLLKSSLTSGVKWSDMAQNGE